MSEFRIGSQPAHGGRSLWTARAGAVCYMLWAFLHLAAAWAVCQLGLGLPDSMVRGRVLQAAFNLAAFSFVGFATAIASNWRNRAAGYWINLGVISVADVGFILFVIVPGYLRPWPGLVGPAFWLGGLVLTTAARAGSAAE